MHTRRVVVCEPGKPAEVRLIENTTEAMRALVGGWLECVPLWDGEHDIWLNEEGKLLGLEPNRMVAAPQPGAGWDIVGTFFVAAHDDAGDTVSIEPAEADRSADALTGITTRCRPLLSTEVATEVTITSWEDE